uniref:Uncharacterized protein n=1 Tax=Arundo donax TaxID=35708 RepID=A0A0A9FKD1_ARUDO
MCPIKQTIISFLFIGIVD